PADAKGPVPLLLNVGFAANNTAVQDDPGVKVGRIWDRTTKSRKSAEGGRGFGRLQVLPTLERGYGIATFNYADIDPDALESISGGVRQLYLKDGATAPAPD